MSLSPPSIGILPEHLIDQIKAGEVIERPGNLIKEILENALDAGAKKIELHVKNNGLDLISLKDDGHGMRHFDLPLAFSRHATSKLSLFEDLYRLQTYGFRGEALASIASIARIQCISYVKSETTGSEIRIEGGHVTFHGERQKAGQVHGTELNIQDLFFNTPARLKFIQSQNSEKQFIKKIIYSFVTARPDVEFHLKIDEEEKDIVLPHESVSERLKALAPKAHQSILHSTRSYEETQLDLYLVPGHIKTPVKWQNISVNGRYILDKQLHRVLLSALQSQLQNDDYQYLAFFTVPAESIDVNVHPNKTIVKFLESSKLLSLLTATVKELIAPKKIQTSHERSTPTLLSQDMLTREMTLPQGRHEYNMDGFFSPHSIPTSDQSLIWLGRHFLKKEERSWTAVHATKLLEAFVEKKLMTVYPSVPLLVSEPYPSQGVRQEKLEYLIKAGLELEPLSADTLVLRSIPDWMNGMPLKDIVTHLLQGRPLRLVELNSRDWSQSTWEEMLNSFSLEELREKKLTIDLERLLKESLP